MHTPPGFIIMIMLTSNVCIAIALMRCWELGIRSRVLLTSEMLLEYYITLHKRPPRH